jgi:mRNA interferase HigB
MRIISYKKIKEAQQTHPETSTALEGWYRLIAKNDFGNFAELKSVFKSVDKVEDRYVFNIGGNKLRLIAIIQFDRRKVYIKHILTHKEYDLTKWKKNS